MDADALLALELLVFEIATYEGDLQQRAMLPLLRFSELTPEQFATTLRARFQALKDECQLAALMSPGRGQAVHCSNNHVSANSAESILSLW